MKDFFGFKNHEIIKTYRLCNSEGVNMLRNNLKIKMPEGVSMLRIGNRAAQSRGANTPKKIRPKNKVRRGQYTPKQSEIQHPVCVQTRLPVNANKTSD